MNYERYKKSRNAAWQILIDLKIDTVPIRVFYILEQLKIRSIEYEDNLEFIKSFGFEELINRTDGFTIKINNQFIICFNGKMAKQRMRFTLAHELGHIILGHITDEIHILSEEQEE